MGFREYIKPGLDSFRKGLSFWGQTLLAFCYIVAGLAIAGGAYLNYSIEKYGLLLSQEFGSGQTFYHAMSVIRISFYGHYYVFLLAVLWAILWGVLCWVVWSIVVILNDMVQIVFIDNVDSYVRIRNRYVNFLDKKLSKIHIVSIFIFLMICTFAIIDSGVMHKGLVDMIKYYGRLVLICVPVIFGITWTYYLLLLNKKGARTYLRSYLFSNDSLRSSFCSIVGAMVFLAALGWFFVPALIISIKWLEEAAAQFMVGYMGYAGKYNYLMASVSSDLNGLPEILNPVKPENLSSHLSVLPDEWLAQYDIFLPLFQKNMFLVLTAISCISIGMPAVVHAAISAGKRKASKLVLVATIKSTLLVAALQFFVREAFFVDISSLGGMGAVFLFSVSFFLMQQSKTAPA